MGYVELVDHTNVTSSTEESEEGSADGSKKKKKASKDEKPRRVGVSNIGKKPEEVTLEDALYFLAFPIHLGEHTAEAFVDEEKGINREAHVGEVTLSLGKFGYYVKFGETLASIPAKFLREELQKTGQHSNQRSIRVESSEREARKRKRREEEEEEEEEESDDYEENENQH